MLIRRCEPDDYEAIYSIINDAAVAYRGKIPADRWHEPYMPMEELLGEITAGVVFWGYEQGDELIGVMGIQDVSDISDANNPNADRLPDVTLIRHAYVQTHARGQGIGGRLLKHLLALTDRPVMIGTWKAAGWAIDFYAKHGFRLVTETEKERLLRTYWSIPERQVATSVVMVDERCDVERE